MIITDYMLQRTIGLVVFIWSTFIFFTFILDKTLTYTLILFEGQVILQSIIPILIGGILVFIWLFSWYKLTIYVLHSGFNARERETEVK